MYVFNVLCRFLKIENEYLKQTKASEIEQD